MVNANARSSSSRFAFIRPTFVAVLVQKNTDTCRRYEICKYISNVVLDQYYLCLEHKKHSCVRDYSNRRYFRRNCLLATMIIKSNSNEINSS
jgi:hypothetical protein